MKTIRNLLHLLSCSLLSSVFFPLSLSAAPNVAPTVTINSAAMRPGTTMMDVSYRVTDPDDATVKVRALAFKDGVRSFANVIRPVTWAEGTASKLGDAIPTNADHTLTWDVATDWNIQLGQVKMEVLAVDSNGIIPFNGITIPAAGDKPELKINQIGLTDAQTFDGLLWFYAAGDPLMEVAYGTLLGSATSGVFKQKPIVAGATLNPSNAQPFLFRLLGIAYAGADIITYANAATRTQLSKSYWLTTNWPYAGTQFVVAWGSNSQRQTDTSALAAEAIAIAATREGSFAIKAGGTVIAWGSFDSSGGNVAGLSDITAIAACQWWNSHYLALKNDGTVVAWGHNGWAPNDGKATVPVGLSGVVAIAVGYDHSVALKNDGTVAVWGSNANGQKNIPLGLSGVTAIAAGGTYTLALINDGTVVAWGTGATSVPAGLTGVSAISAGPHHALALKNDGTVVAWGDNEDGRATIPPGLSGVTGIAAGDRHNLALKSDGTVIAWGHNESGKATVPAGLTGVSAISAGGNHSLAIMKAP